MGSVQRASDTPGERSAATRTRLRLFLAVMLLSALLLGWAHLRYGASDAGASHWLDLETKRNLADWFSAVTLLLLSGSAVTAYRRERKHDAATHFRMPQFWIGVALAAGVMAVHQISNLRASDQLLQAWVFLSEWPLLFGPAILGVVAVFIAFLTNRYLASRDALVRGASAIACWIGALAVGGLRSTWDLEPVAFHAPEVVLSQELGMVGAVLMLASVLSYTADITFDFSDQRRAQLGVASRLLTRRSLATVAVVALGLTLAGGSAAWFARQQGTTGTTAAMPQPGASAASAQPAPQLPEVRAAIARSAGYLVAACGPDGRFNYRINMNPKVTPKPKYNVLRHAGAMVALSQLERRKGNDDVRQALQRAGRFLLQECVAPVPGEDDNLAVWSKPEINGADAPLQAKLGASGLGLVALLSLEAVEPGSVTLEQLRGLGRFVVSMQKETGEFYSKYVPSEGGRQDRWTSLYYPGEAALGLIMLYEKDPMDIWLHAAAKALGYLARVRQGEMTVDPDHWALLASARMLPLYDRVELPLPREQLVAHAIQICESVLSEQVLTDDDARVVGGFKSDGRTAAASTRIEGLLAALDIIPDDRAALRERTSAAIQRGVTFLLAAQVRQGPFIGAVPRAVRRVPRSDPSYDRAFDRRATEVRIDYVQHTVSALLGYERRVP